MSMRFRSVIEILGVNPYVLISAKRAMKIKKGWCKPLPVRIRVNGKPEKPWRINLVPRGDGSFYLYLHGNVRRASKTKVGDAVNIELEFDDEYKSGPAHPVPAWFSTAMRQNPAAKQTWNGLTPSLRKEVLRYLSRLKSPEAKSRNLKLAMSALSGTRTRFLGRIWNG